MPEDYDSDIDRTQNRQLVRFLKEAAFTFEKGAIGKMSVASKHIRLLLLTLIGSDHP